jgi:hypothetical protein
VNPIPCYLASAALTLAFSPAARFFNLVLVCLVPASPPSLLSAFAHNGSASANHSARDLALHSVDGDVVCSKRASERRAASTGRRRDIPGVEGPTGVAQGAQPTVRLRRQLHQAARAWLHRAGEPLSCGGSVTTMRWSSTTSPPTPYHRWPPSLASARGSWGSW